MKKLPYVTGTTQRRYVLRVRYEITTRILDSYTTRYLRPVSSIK